MRFDDVIKISESTLLSQDDSVAVGELDKNDDLGIIDVPETSYGWFNDSSDECDELDLNTPRDRGRSAEIGLSLQKMSRRQAHSAILQYLALQSRKPQQNEIFHCHFESPRSKTSGFYSFWVICLCDLFCFTDPTYQIVGSMPSKPIRSRTTFQRRENSKTGWGRQGIVSAFIAPDTPPDSIQYFGRRQKSAPVVISKRTYTLANANNVFERVEYHNLAAKDDMKEGQAEENVDGEKDKLRVRSAPTYRSPVRFHYL